MIAQGKPTMKIAISLEGLFHILGMMNARITTLDNTCCSTVNGLFGVSLSTANTKSNIWANCAICKQSFQHFGEPVRR